MEEGQTTFNTEDTSIIYDENDKPIEEEAENVYTENN